MPKHLDPLEKAKQNPRSLRLAINAKCYECEGEDYDPCVRWRIGNCLCSDCPLYPQRPHQHLAGRPTPKTLEFMDHYYYKGSKVK